MSLKFPTIHLLYASKTTNLAFSRSLAHQALYPDDSFFFSNDQVWGYTDTRDDVVDPVGPSLLAQLQRGFVRQTPYILNKLISFSAKSTLLRLGSHLHSVVVKMGFHSNVYINSALVDMYGKCGVISSAQQMFEEMRERNVATWNTLMSAYVHSGYPKIAIHLFLEMLRHVISPSQISVSTVLASCAQLQAQVLGAQVHAFCFKVGFCYNVVVGTGLIDMYAKCLSIEASREVFHEMPDKNVVTWTSLVTGYAQNQQPHEAMILVRKMLRFDLKPSYVTYISLLNSFHYPSDLDRCKQVHSRVIQEGLEAYIYVTVTLLTAYSECGSSIDDFNRICSTVRIWDQVSWSAVIAGYSELGKGWDALICFSEMRQGGITGDFFTFTSILRAAGIIPALDVGKQIHSLVLKTGYVSNLFVQNGLISMYARCGKIVDAKEMFLSMTKHDLISWNSLLSGLANHGHGREAVAMFDQMRRTVVKPDLTTFLAVLSACSHVGLLDKGLEYFELMRSDDSLQPIKLEHYACVVDLYGRAGHLSEAEAFINSMPIEPSPSVFKALLSSCQIHGNTEIAARSVRKLVELYPNDPGIYVLLANVLANGGYWDNAAGVRKLMCDRGVRKNCGSSWIWS